MRSLTRRGFTLVELLVVVGLTGVVLGAIYQSIVTTQWATRAQLQRMHVQQESRAARVFLTNVLLELDAAEGDVPLADSTTIRTRAPRWAGVLCTIPAEVGGSMSFVLRAPLLTGLRDPDPERDSLLIFRDGDSGSRADDQWLVAGLDGVAAGACPDGTPGWVLAVTISAASGGSDSALVGVTDGSPVRGVQVEETSLYRDGGGDYWLGYRTANKAGTWTPVQRIIGPLTADGLTFSYLDVAGAATATVTEIASVALTIRIRSQVPTRLSLGGTDYIRDSVITRVALRNNPRI
jgi:prepilin-type N-terminal cleavage/methylation domain-containing protein